MAPLDHMAVFLAATLVRPYKFVWLKALADPLSLATKLSFVMSEFYEANNRDAQSCSFSGNGTVNTAAPSSVSAANAAASSCVSNPSAVFTPGAPSDNPGSQSSPSGTGKPRKNAASPLFGELQGSLGLAMMVVLSVTSAVWTLA